VKVPTPGRGRVGGSRIELGIEKIPFASLPEEIQKKYHFDPEAAAKLQ